MYLRAGRRQRARAVVAVVLALVVSGCAAGAPSARSIPTVTVRVTVPPLTSAAGTGVGSGGPSASSGATEAGGASALSSAGPRSATPTGPAGDPTANGSSAPIGAAPGSALVVTAADRWAAGAVVAGLSTADKAASVIVTDGAQLVGSPLLTQYHFGGVILMGTRGVVDGTAGGTPQQVAALTSALRQQAAGDPARAPLLIGTDQEYGDVVRLQYGFTDFPGASQLAAIDDTDRAVSLTREVAAAAAQEMLAVGVTVDFAPVSDVLPTDGSLSAIGNRSYGADPQRVARLVAAAVTGYQGAGLAAVLKHFPGLGRLATDTHTALPALRVSCSSWNEHEAPPVRAGIAAGVSMVMTGHVLLPAVGDTAVPASMSAPVVSGLLRGSGSGGCPGMRYPGIAVTDSLQMEPIANVYTSGQAAVRALNAGEDLLLMPLDPVGAVHGIVAAVDSGELARARLDDAATAVLALRLATARVPRPSIDVVGSPAHRELAADARAAANG